MSVADLAIICTSASCGPEEIRRYFDAGMNDVLPKPIDFDKLQQLIERWLP